MPPVARLLGCPELATELRDAETYPPSDVGDASPIEPS